MANSMVVKVICFVVMCMVLGTSFADGTFTCGEVQLTLVPCLDYLRNPETYIPKSCCNGVRVLNDKCNTISARQSACSCLKSVSVTILGINLPALASLPAKCGVHLPFKPSPSVDCNEIH